MKCVKWLTALFLSAIILLNACLALAYQDGFRTTYTYNYDYWGDLAESPDAYRVQQVIYSASLGLETPMRRPQSLYVRDNDVYVCDTGNNRVLQLRRDGNDFSLVRIIDRIAGAEPETMNSPGDVFADEEGNVYVNDKLLEEPYVEKKSLGKCQLEFPYQVPDNKYFLLGDQRENSSDSRNPDVGCVSEDQIIGRVMFRIWPLK